MRARRSWPRSSVPNGCFSDGPARRALKSMSLIGTCQIHGPASTANRMINRISAPPKASLWRRKRRHASVPQPTRGRIAPPAPEALAEADAGIEPAIEDVGDEVEEDHQAREHEGHRHDHRG